MRDALAHYRYITFVKPKVKIQNYTKQDQIIVDAKCINPVADGVVLIILSSFVGGVGGGQSTLCLMTLDDA